MTLTLTRLRRGYGGQALSLEGRGEGGETRDGRWLMADGRERLTVKAGGMVSGKRLMGEGRHGGNFETAFRLGPIRLTQGKQATLPAERRTEAAEMVASAAHLDASRRTRLQQAQHDSREVWGDSLGRDEGGGIRPSDGASRPTIRKGAARWASSPYQRQQTGRSVRAYQARLQWWIGQLSTQDNCAGVGKGFVVESMRMENDR